MIETTENENSTRCNVHYVATVIQKSCVWETAQKMTAKNKIVTMHTMTFKLYRHCQSLTIFNPILRNNNFLDELQTSMRFKFIGP